MTPKALSREIKFRMWDNSKYDIGNDGSVWSNDFNNSGKRKELKTYIEKDGYRIVYLTIGGIRKIYPVRKLVALTWLGERPEGLVINHKNGIPNDDRAENLEYVTQSYNTKHGWDIGRKVTDKMRQASSRNMVKINIKKYAKTI